MIKRFRHIILIMFMALQAIYSIAQIAMPDKVCVGTNRHYWVQNVLPGSVFTWAINGATQTSTTDFIDIYWTVAGTYTLTVQEHQANCDGEVQVGMVTVSDPVVPVFAPIAPLCQNSLAPPLPTVSTNSITGSWSPNTISTAMAGTTTYTFTPDDGQCATTVSLTIVVNEPIVPSFAAIGPLCKNSIAPPLLLTSINGITGTWSPSVISTAIAGTASYTFTPTAGLCASPVTITIEVIEPTVPQFALIGPLCINTVAPTLPAISINGIPGSWSPAVISTAATGTATYTFTPDLGQCATTASLTIEVTQPLAFAGPAETICPGNPYTLSAATAQYYSSLLWTTSGNGTFNDPTLLHPIYTPGSTDIASGAVTLTLTAQGLGTAPNCAPAVSSVRITILNLKAEISPTPQNISCFGANDGVIFVSNPSGGSGEYEFSRDGGASWIKQGDLPFKNVPKGEFTILMRDNNFTACIAILGTVEILEPGKLSAAEPRGSDASCKGNDGIISVIGATGGWGNYRYKLNNEAWQSSGDFSKLVPGKYEVWIGDADSPKCMESLGEIEIKLPPPLTASVSSANVSCNGRNDGSIIVSNRSGGSGVFELSIDEGKTWKPENELPFTDVKPGVYVVQMRDYWSNECVNAIGTATITEPELLTAKATPTNVTCFGYFDGKITISAASGGYGKYEYTVNNLDWSNKTEITFLKPGTYSVTMRDADQPTCETSLGEYSIIEPPQLQAKVDYDGITCNGAANGKITVYEPQNGVGTYQYTIKHTTSGFTSTNTDGKFTGLAKGDYLVSMQDSRPCKQDLITITITEPELLTATVKHTDETCAGSDGTIAISEPKNSYSNLYEYSINGINWISDKLTFTGLSSNTYTVRIRDAHLPNACERTLETIHIDAPIPLAATATSTNVTCNGANDGTITIVNQSGGSGLYEYTLDADHNLTNNIWQDDSPVFNSVSPGTYEIWMRDKNAPDCKILVDKKTITEPAELKATPVAVDVTCFGGSDGKITFSGASGGTDPGNYEYSINGTNWYKNQITNLPEGPYKVQMRDGKVPACSVILNSVDIKQPERLTATVTPTPVKCFGESTGEIRITEPKNGLGSDSDYNYRIIGVNGGTWTNVSVFTGLVAGPYTVEIQDGLNNDCTATLTPTTISQPLEPLVAVGEPSHTNETGPGKNDGTITIVPPTGGTPRYQYSIDSGVTWSTTTYFTGLKPGSYTIMARDANGCELTILPDQIIQPSGAITASYKLTPVKCYGGADGIIEFINYSGAMNSNYEFSINGGSSWGVVNQYRFENKPSSSYTLMVRDADNRTTISTIATIILGQPSAPVSAMVIATGETALNANDGIITISNFAGGSGGYQYRLDGGSWIAAAGPTVEIKPLAPKIYTVDIRDKNGCPATYYPVDVSEFTIEGVTATINPVQTCFGASSGMISIANVSGGLGTGKYTYRYRLVGNPVWISAPYDPVKTEIKGLAKGMYELEVTDDNAGSVPYSKKFDIVEFPEIKVSLSADPIACFGGDTYVNFNITGGTEPYKKYFNGFEISSFVPKASSYDFTIVDANGCSVPAHIDITQPVEIIMFAKGNNPKNCGERGSIDFTFTNVPNGNYTISYNDGANNLSRNVSVVAGKASWLLLPTGRYENMKILVKGCYSKETTVIISDPSAPVYAVQSSNPTICTGKDGSILVTGLNTNTTYSVSKNNGTTYTNTTSSADGKITISNLAAGPYDVVLKLNGCTGETKHVVLSDPPTPTLAAVATNPAVCGDNGTIRFTFTNVPNGTYTITYNDGTVDRAFNNVTVVANGATVSVTAGTYTNLRIKLNGCESNAVGPLKITDTLGAPVPFAVALKLPTCNDPKGIVEVTKPLGSQYQYSLDGIKYSNSPVFADVAPGKYVVWVKDILTLCVAKGNEVDNSLPPVSVDLVAVVIHQPDCEVLTGTIAVNQPAAGSGFTYRIDGGTWTSSVTFTGLLPGTHSVTIKETSTGCESQPQSLTIDPIPSAPEVPIASVTQQPTCLVSGIIEITKPEVGTGFEYSIDDGATWTSSVKFTDREPGKTYSVRVKDSATKCVSLPLDLKVNDIPAAPEAPLASVSVQPSCKAPSGVIVVNKPAVGTGFEYSIDGGAHWTSSTTFGGLNPGTYSITVKEISTGCISLPSAAQLVNEVPEAPKAPVAHVVPGFPNCDTPLGIIEVTSPGILFPDYTGYKYSLNGNKRTDFIFTGLVPGNYSLRLIDPTGCESPDILLVVPGVPDPPTLEASIAKPDCIVRTGTISVTVTNRVIGQNYRYSKNGGSTWQNGNEFTGLNPGPYSIAVLNVTTSCSSTISVTIPPAPEIPVAPALVAIQPDCTLATGTIEVTSPVGLGYYTYSINGGTPTSSTTFGNLNPGDYKVVAVSGGGCTSTESKKTISPHSLAPPVPTVESIQPTCTVATGTIQVIPPVGSGYKYSKDGLTYQDNPTFTGLIPGTYTITVKNSEGCISGAFIQIIDEQPPTPSVPDISSVQPNCQVETGTIIINSPTGAGYIYSILGVATYTESTTFSGLSPGTYTVTVMNSDGCIATATQTIDGIPSQPAVPVYSLTKPNCKPNQNGIIKVLPPSGTDYLYSLDGGTFTTATTFTNVDTGTHTLTVLDGTSSCTNSVSIPVVKETDPPVPVLAVTPPNCVPYESTITVMSPVLEGTYEYSINGGLFSSVTTYIGMPGNTYTVTVRNILTDCISLAEATVTTTTPTSPATPSATVTVNPTCENPDGTVVVKSPVGVDYVYTIAGKTQTSATFTDLITGTYTITATNAKTGCSSLGSIEVPAIPPSPVITSVSKVDPKCYGDTYTITINVPPVISAGKTYVFDGIYTFNFNANEKFENDVTILNGTATITGVGTESKTFEDVWFEVNGCTSTGTNTSITIVVPNKFAIVDYKVTEQPLKGTQKGEIDLTLSGGTPDYRFSWTSDTFVGIIATTTSSVTSSLTKLMAGNYSVTILDNNNCPTGRTFIVPSNLPPIAVDDPYKYNCSPLHENVLVNDKAPEDDDFITINTTPVVSPKHAKNFRINADGTFDYEVIPGYTGIDGFVYEIADKFGQTATATVSILVAADFDGDGIADKDDDDADGDGILNVDEALPGQNWKTADFDGDGHPNWLDIDSDNDGIVDNIEAQSTADYIAPTGTVNIHGVDDAYNPDKGGVKLIPVNTDANLYMPDNQPDFLDADSDNDHVPDYIEGHDDDSDGKVDPGHLITGKDSDEDGLDDAWDTIVNGCNNMNATGSNAFIQDFDGDGIRDWRDDNDDDDEYPTRLEDLNADGDFSNDVTGHVGHPEYLWFGRDCSLFIPDAFSPNDDNVHDYFQIYCIEQYPNAKMYIFDQQGNKLFEKDHYGNVDFWGSHEQAWWDGTTTNRIAAVNGRKVVPGTYYYVLKLGNGETKKSFVFVSY